MFDKEKWALGNAVPWDIAAGAMVGRAELSHLPLWFEQQDWKTVDPQSPMTGVPREAMRGSGQPQAQDSISVGLPGAGDVTFILTQCLHSTFMTAAEQLVSDRAPSQLVPNYIIQLFLWIFLLFYF